MIPVRTLAAIVVLVVFSGGLVVGYYADRGGLWPAVLALLVVVLPVGVLVELARRAVRL